MAEPVVVSRAVAAPPELVWSMISDLPRMGEWSPENTGGTWRKGATGPAVGARFKGTNANGKKSWSTAVEVKRCDPAKAFAFKVTSGGLSVATWSFELEPSAAGCTVTETWLDERGWLVKTLGGPVSGVRERDDEHTRKGMEATLEGLAAAAEASATTPQS
jgi:uncharacterized protein YndB with AHSA1/START domain